MWGVDSSARKHGVADADIRHAVDNAQAIEDAGEDPDSWLVLGPGRNANMLELVVMVSAEGDRTVIHAMAMRAQYRRLLEP